MNNTSGNKLGLIIGIISLASVIVLYALFFTSKSKTTGSEGKSNESGVVSNSDLNIAYINLDSLLLQYQMAIDLNEDLLTEHAKSKANLERQVKQFEKDYNAFMEKARLGTFLSQASMESQQNELIEKQHRLQVLDEQLTNELLEKQADMNIKLFDSVMNYVKEFNQDQYDLILGNSSGAIVLYGKEGMDITEEVVSNLNKRYKDSKK